jgi:hypothetical protein
MARHGEARLGKAGGAKMVDVAKCANAECPRKSACYRFTAPESVWQSYAAFCPTDDGECYGFIDNGMGSNAYSEPRGVLETSTIQGTAPTLTAGKDRA